MIKYIQGNILESNAEVLINPVNTVGVMGAGLALEFKKKYPGMFNEYRRLCKEGIIKIGVLISFDCGDKVIIAFPTKQHWRESSQRNHIDRGLREFAKNYHKLNKTSFAFPKLGCGLGGLDWDKQVKPLMERYLGNLPVDIYIYI